MAEFIKVDALGDACPLPVVKAKRRFPSCRARDRWRYWWTTRSLCKT